MPPRPPRPPRSPRQRRLRSRTRSVPSCPASSQMVSRGPPPAACWMSLQTGFVAAWPIHDSPLSARGRHGVIRACLGASPNAVPPYSVSRNGSGTWTAATTSGGPPRPTPDFRRLSGLPVCRSPLRPRRTRAASWMALRYHRHQSGTSAACLASCAAAALQRRFARCHYLLSATRIRVPGRTSGRSATNRKGSDSAEMLGTARRPPW